MAPRFPVVLEPEEWDLFQRPGSVAEILRAHGRSTSPDLTDAQIICLIPHLAPFLLRKRIVEMVGLRLAQYKLPVESRPPHGDGARNLYIGESRVCSLAARGSLTSRSSSLRLLQTRSQLSSSRNRAARFATTSRIPTSFSSSTTCHWSSQLTVISRTCSRSSVKRRFEPAFARSGRT